MSGTECLTFIGMKIYTKTGDGGDTGLFGGPRVRKDGLRIETYGEVDELNAALGLARALGIPPPIDAELARIQAELFSVGAELATPEPIEHGTALIGPRQIEWLESTIDRHEATLEPLKNFILPGGSAGASALHLARTICRRAERRLVTLIDTGDEPISNYLLVYLNRLSDLLFVLARAANAAAEFPDVPWEKPSV